MESSPVGVLRKLQSHAFWAAAVVGLDAHLGVLDPAQIRGETGSAFKHVSHVLRVRQVPAGDVAREAGGAGEHAGRVRPRSGPPNR